MNEQKSIDQNQLNNKLTIKEKFMRSIELFYTFFKIGAFTFGGGLAMLPLIERIVVEKKKWMDSEEMVNMVAISQSTPGVIAVNSATYIGYRRAGVLGAIFATLGVVFPSLVIICLISYFYDEFMKIEVVKWAFLGMKAGVAVLIFNAGIRLIKKVKKDYYGIIILLLSLLISLFFPFISSVYIIASGLILGIIFYGIIVYKKEEANNDLS